jgi:hypothetical protein
MWKRSTLAYFVLFTIFVPSSTSPSTWRSAYHLRGRADRRSLLHRGGPVLKVIVGGELKEYNNPALDVVSSLETGPETG